ncbi:hypothetical protein H2201_006158 [Coniosporium apollinis]|uniref:Uncharacterized protein n=1 Tax=Coniosporium apollinis TaxID=61459 RepID=A0ABQ9NMP5_9PEZI|nr:hypothetical protein H2201_006158 [Coniosporium apollinis]
MENSRTPTLSDLNRPDGPDPAADGSKSWSRRTLFGSLKAKLLRSRPSIKDIVDPARCEAGDEENCPQTPSSKRQTLSLGSLSRSKRRQRASVLDSPNAPQEFQDGSPNHKRNTSKSDAIKRFAASSIGRRTDRDVIIMMNAPEEQRSASTVASEAPSVDVDIPTGGLGSLGEKEYDLFSDTVYSSTRFARRGALLHDDVHVQRLYPPAPIEVHHSSPVPVPGVKRDSAICLLPLPITESSLDGSEVITPEEMNKSEFTVGSVPDPTPMITWAAHLPTREPHAKHHLGKLDLSTAAAEAPQALPTPMPGTILPLEDPFEDFPTVPNEPCATHASEPSADPTHCSPKELSAQTSFNEELQALKNPDAGHVDHNTGLWESNDPFARGGVGTLSGASAEIW